MREKIKSREELAKLCEVFRKQSKKIGFTSGVFDLIHAGHVDYLEKAKDMCDVLIVGVNSDVSVKEFKGGPRPIIPEAERAKVVAGFDAVDYVFIFDERRNKKNIEFLKPNYYIKAGDYSKGELTSGEVIEKLGGEVKLIEKSFDISTTDIIDKISACKTSAHMAVPELCPFCGRELAACSTLPDSFPSCKQEQVGGGKSSTVPAGKVVEEGDAVHFPRTPAKVSLAIFIDRDGTINEDIGYLHEPEKLKFLPNVFEGVKKMRDMGYKIVVITNQSGIGLGYFTNEDFYSVNTKMLKGFSAAGITLSKIYFCPHSKDEGCECRKPGIALIERASRDLNLDITRSYIIGDTTLDIEAGKRAGAKTILVRTGFGGSDGNFLVVPDYTADDLLDAANYILEQERS